MLFYYTIPAIKKFLEFLLIGLLCLYRARYHPEFPQLGGAGGTPTGYEISVAGIYIET